MRPELLRSFNQIVARTERLRPGELRSYQMSLLTKMLAHARDTTAFYRGRLDFDVTVRENVERMWSKIPILTRAEVIANYHRLASSKTPAEVGPPVKDQTTGSTGDPLDFQMSLAQLVSCRALTERMYRWWAVAGSKSFAQISYDPGGRSPTPQGASTRGWHSAAPNGVAHFLSHAFDIDTQLDWLAVRKPNYLMSYSSILKGLAIAAHKRGVPLEFDLIFSIATVVDKEIRSLCQSIFSSEIADTYGAQEVGHIAAQCPECGEYHVSAEAVLLEILREDGSPAASGETGRVIVTPLYNYAMPFVRYEVGDLAEFGTADPICSRKLPTLRRIFGRYRNLFRFRDGTTLWPIGPKFALSDFSIRQFQVVQTDLDHIEIRYVRESDRPIDLVALTERVRNALGQPVDVSLRVVNKIERSPSGKFENFISLVPGAP
jgi:phenylacetate-CoA ligase